MGEDGAWPFLEGGERERARRLFSFGGWFRGVVRASPARRTLAQSPVRARCARRAVAVESGSTWRGSGARIQTNCCSWRRDCRSLPAKSAQNRLADSGPGVLQCRAASAYHPLEKSDWLAGAARAGGHWPPHSRREKLTCGSARVKKAPENVAFLQSTARIPRLPREPAGGAARGPAAPQCGRPRAPCGAGAYPTPAFPCARHCR